jgi:hypothetical protein
MHHGVVEVVAYQETLLIMAVFGVAILAMTWIGFRRWLQHKENLAQINAGQTAERSENRAQMERVEGRLKAIEQVVSEGASNATARVETSAGPPAGRS